MTRNLSQTSRYFRNSLVLGSLGCLAVLMDKYLFTAIYLPLELILIVWGLKILPISAMALMLLLCMSPYLLIWAEPGHVAATTFLSAALFIANKKLPRAPLMVTVALFWACLWGPLTLLFPFQLAGGSITHADIILSSSSEIFIVSLASLLLLLPAINNRLSAWPITLSAYTLITNTISLATTFCLTLVLHLIPGDAFIYFDILDPSSLSHIALMSAIVLTVSGLPALLAYPLAQISKEVSEESWSAALRGNSDSFFSEISSKHWCTKTELEGNSCFKEPAREASARRAFSLSAWDLANGVLIMDQNLSVHFNNDAFVKVAQGFEHSCANTRFDQWQISPELKNSIIKATRTVLEAGTPANCEIKLNDLPDDLRFFHISARPHAGPKQNPSAIAIVTICDITKRRTFESQVISSQKLSALGAMVRNMAHSFNNSLMAISGHASVAKQAPNQRTLSESINEIIKASEQAASNIKQLLAYIQERPAVLEKTNFFELINSNNQLLKSAAGEGIEIKVKMPDKPLYVLCDSALMLQAITNLILNSREAYKGFSGMIEMEVDTEFFEDDAPGFYPGASPGNYLRFKLRDYGPAIDPEIFTRCFDSISNPEVGPIQDIKLSATYSIVRAHSGFIIVESRSGHGSLISIYLPLIQSTEQKRIPRKVKSLGLSPEKLKGNQERILVVEDQESVRNLVENMLTTLNYQVISCSNGAEALKHLLACKTDLVIVDMVMPGMDGAEILRSLKDISSGSRALIMTGYGATADAGELERPMIIHKPFGLEALGQAVKSALAMKVD